MSAKMAGRRNHRSAAKAFDYQVKDQVVLGFGRKVALYRGDQFVGTVTKKQFVALASGVGPNGEKLRRPHPRASQGELLCLSLPATVTGAMKLAGLLADPKAAFALLSPGRAAAMKKANEHAHGRTTGGKLVKGDLTYAVFPGHANRAGEACPQFNVWVMPSVRAAGGKRYALYGRELFRAQKAIQGAWHLGVAHALRAKGVVCGPAGNSFTANGVNANTRRSAQMRAKLRRAKTKGPKARKAAAGATRGPKVTPPWAAAVAAFAASVTGAVVRTVRAASDARQARLARRCVKAAFAYCNDNSWRYTRADAYATAAHLALPHVAPAIFDREFARLALKPERLGAAVKAAYPGGNALYESKAHAANADRAALALWAMERKRGGGLAPRRVAKALAGTGCTPAQYAAVQKLAADRRAVLDPGALADPASLRLAAKAYKARGGDVYAVGAAAGKALGAAPFSPFGLAETLTRTSHLRSLWRGLRTPGSLDHKLWVAEQVRANGHTKLKRGSLVVAAVDDTRDAASVARLAEAVRRAGGKLIVTGAGAAEFAALGQTQAQRGGAQRPGASAGGTKTAAGAARPKGPRRARGAHP